MYGFFSSNYEKNKQYKSPEEIEAYVNMMKNSKYYKRLLKATDSASKRDLREWNTLIRKYKKNNKKPSRALQERRRENARRWRKENRDHISDYNKSTYRTKKLKKNP